MHFFCRAKHLLPYLWYAYVCLSNTTLPFFNLFPGFIIENFANQFFLCFEVYYNSDHLYGGLMFWANFMPTSCRSFPFSHSPGFLLVSIFALCLQTFLLCLPFKVKILNSLSFHPIPRNGACIQRRQNESAYSDSFTRLYL